MGIIVCTHEFRGEERIRGEGKDVVENLPTPSFPVLESDFFPSGVSDHLFSLFWDFFFCEHSSRKGGREKKGAVILTKWGHFRLS